MNTLIEAHHLTKRYRTVTALYDCTFALPTGKIVALVGPNGAGKSTLLHLMMGLLAPTEGELTIMGASPQHHPERVLPHIGFVAQDHPLYGKLSVEDMLVIGRSLNPHWDDPLVRTRLAQLNIPLNRHCDTFSGGQQAQIALALAVGKRPDVLLLDEPLASLDPLARRDFMRLLMDTVATLGITVVLSSHNIGDLERICDHLMILADGKIRLLGDIETLTQQHKLLVGPKDRVKAIAHTHPLITMQSTGRQATLVVKTNGAIAEPAWDIHDVSLEDLVMAYLERAQSPSPIALVKEEISL